MKEFKEVDMSGVDKKERNKKMQELMSGFNFDDLSIKRNYIEFEVGDEKLRVKKINVADELEAKKAKNKYYVKLLRNDEYLTRKELVEIYKNKGIDVDKFDRDWDEVQKEVEATQLVLAKTPDKKKEDIARLKTKILTLKSKQIAISGEKTDLLQFSLEDEVRQYWYMYVTYLSTETFKDGGWIRKWKSYDEMIKDETDIVGIALIRAMELMDLY